MFTDSHFTDHFNQVSEQYKTILAELLQAIPHTLPKLELEHCENLLAHKDTANTLLLLEQGVVHREQNQRVIYTYDDGDLLGVDHPLMASLENPYRLFAEHDIVLQPYDYQEFQQHVFNAPELSQRWWQLMVIEQTRRDLLVSQFSAQPDRTAQGFQNFSAGDVIIAEGTASDTVYSIVDGSADVTVKGVKVGEIGSDEVFGAFSLLTNSPRTATVTATSDCLVIVVPEQQFESLLQSHPKLCMTLMKNMAKHIVVMNTQISTRT